MVQWGPREEEIVESDAEEEEILEEREAAPLRIRISGARHRGTPSAAAAAEAAVVVVVVAAAAAAAAALSITQSI